MSLNRSVVIVCDHFDSKGLCRAQFTVGTTIARVTREQAYIEGWYTSAGTGVEEQDFCPKHLPPWDSRR